METVKIIITVLIFICNYFSFGKSFQIENIKQQVVNQDCDSIKIIEIDTLVHHYVLKSNLYSSGENVKVIVKKEGANTLELGISYCFVLNNYRVPFVDGNGTEYFLSADAYCVDLDENDSVCIDLIHYKQMFYIRIE